MEDYTFSLEFMIENILIFDTPQGVILPKNINILAFINVL